MYLKNLWQGLNFWKKGIIVSIVLIVLGLLFAIITVSVSYTGKCGSSNSFFGFIAGGHINCPFTKYLISNIFFYAFIAILSYGWLLLLIFIIPILIFYLVDKYKKR